MARRSGFLLCTIVILAAVSLPAEAQQKRLESLQSIEKSYKNGQLSLDTKMLYQFKLLTKPSELPEAYRTDELSFLKCATPQMISYYHHRDKLRPATIAEIESMKSRSLQAAETYLSASGKFEITYETTGEDAVPPDDNNSNSVPDYVEWVAQAADSSWRHQINTLGYTDPVFGDSSPYPIFIEVPFSQNVYGYTDTGNNRGLASDTYIVINNDFVGFPDNTDPEGNVRGAIKVTVAHELKHAVQYANSAWYGSLGNDDNPHGLGWSEMDATYMEEVVYDNVNDYYNYLGGDSIFTSFRHRIPVAYSGVSWFIFAEEYLSGQLWVDVWQQIKQVYETEKNKATPNFAEMIPTIDQVLTDNFNSSFNEAFIHAHIWHYASGPGRSPMDFGFEEREFYPGPNINYVTNDTMGAYTDTLNLLPESAHYIDMDSDNTIKGNLAMDVQNFGDQNLQVGFIAYFTDGSTMAETYEAAPGGVTNNIQTSFPWEDLVEVGIIFGNTSENETKYRIWIQSSVPKEIVLRQNYPNPFNPTTTIRFGVPDPGPVRIELYDILGRRVRTLIDQTYEAGSYQEQFDLSSLSSGVYLYRLVTQGRSLTRKMTLIK